MTEETRAPTQSDAVQIGVAGSEAVNPETQTPSEAQEASRTAMETRARELKVTLAPEALEQMSARFIEALREAGAFKDDSEPENGSPPAEPATPPATPESQPPPEKKTLAQKLLGNR